MNQEQEIKKIISEQKEWQENQFIPGYWVGGKIPPYLLRKNKKLGIVFIIVGIIGLVSCIIASSSQDISQFIIPLILTTLMLFAGYIKLRGN